MHPEHAQAAGNFLIPNGTFVFEWIVFGLVLLFLWRKVIPMITKRMEERQEAIRRQFEEAEQLHAAAQQALGEYRQAQSAIRAEAAAIREEARADARRIGDELREKAREEADRIIERASQQLETDRQRLAAELRTEIGELAVELAGRITGEALADAELQRRVVDRFLIELDDEAAPDRPAAAQEQPPQKVG